MSREIFVFGSNEAGIHGGGAARYAFDKLGAVWGRGVGPQGHCYAIPTKDHEINTLPLACIRVYVHGFLHHATQHPEITFHVTQIGCGLAGLKPEDMAPMFQDAPANCKFSSAWEPWLSGREWWTDK